MPAEAPGDNELEEVGGLVEVEVGLAVTPDEPVVARATL